MDEEILESTWEALRQETDIDSSAPPQQSQQHSYSEQGKEQPPVVSRVENEETSDAKPSQSSSAKKLTPAQRKELRKKKLQERGENRLNEIRGLLGKTPSSAPEPEAETRDTEERPTCTPSFSEPRQASHATHHGDSSQYSTQQDHKASQIPTNLGKDLKQEGTQANIESSTSARPLNGDTVQTEEISKPSSMIDNIKAIWKAESSERIFTVLKWVLLVLGAVYCGLQLPHCTVESDAQWFWEHSRVHGDTIFAPRYLTVFRLQQAQHSMPEHLQNAHQAAVLKDQEAFSMDSALCHLNHYIEESSWLPLSYPLLIIASIELCKSISKQVILWQSAGHVSWNFSSVSGLDMLSFLHQWLWPLMERWNGIISEIAFFVVCSVITASILDAYSSDVLNFQ
eukprot:gb/GECG01006874.1/.p1 GENE.gb/GECG01006874.1/~~gb/GECG01006874.1/.p1  ORF type:complete len:398 (+),score=65.30 gb/GECG01006874.1/:1-1194(+)